MTIAYVYAPMPAPGWGEHDTGGHHIDPLSVHDGIDIIASIEHEAQCGRRVAMRSVVMGCGASLLRIPRRQVTATPISGVRCLPRVSGPSDIAMMKLIVPPKVPMAIGIAKPRSQLAAK